MFVGRNFWTRQKGNIVQSFSYAKDSNAAKFADKYGGTVVPGLEVDDELPKEVWSYLVNNSPIENTSTTSDGPFVVMINEQGSWKEHKSFSSISEANTEAKNIIANYSKVAVIKND